MDIDGDGLPDRVEQSVNSPYTNFWYVLRNTGTNFYSGGANSYYWGFIDAEGNTSSGLSDPVSINGDGATLMDLVDINGDGYPDRVEANLTAPYDGFYDVQINTGTPSISSSPTNLLPAVSWSGVLQPNGNDSDWGCGAVPVATLILSI